MIAESSFESESAKCLEVSERYWEVAVVLQNIGSSMRDYKFCPQCGSPVKVDGNGHLKEVKEEKRLDTYFDFRTKRYIIFDRKRNRVFAVDERTLELNG